MIIITTSPEKFGEVSSQLEKEGFEIEGEVGLSPINLVNIAGSEAKQLLQLLEKLEENEDIQKVYSNFDLDEAELSSSEILHDTKTGKVILLPNIWGIWVFFCIICCNTN